MDGPVSSGIVLVGCGSTPGASGTTAAISVSGSAIISLSSSTNYDATGETNFNKTVAHEIGHAIGLGHSDDSASIMSYRSGGWNGLPDYLSQDDIDGVEFLYPNKEELGGLLGSCKSFAGNGSAGSSNMFLEQMISAFLASILIRKLFSIFFA